MSSPQQDTFFNAIPPAVSGTYKVQNDTTGAAAAAFDWYGGLSTDAPVGRVWLYLEAVTTDAYVRFGSSSTTGTTANNGVIVKAGSPGVVFYVDPVLHRYIDHIAPAGAGKLKVQVCSHPGNRRVQ